MGLNNQIGERATAELIAMIESGNAMIWDRPWSSNGPRALNTGKEYRGINRLILSVTSMVKTYASPYWATLAQINFKGGRVRKGENGTQIVFWNRVETNVRDENDEIEGDEVDRRYRFFMRLYTVFNIEQTTISADKLPKIEARENHPIEDAEALFGGYFAAPASPRLCLGNHEAYYRPSTDEVHMPSLAAFHDAESFYAVLAHEVGHSTGHPSRLNRPEIANVQGFSSASYSAEECCAELAASFVTSYLGIDNAKGKNRSAAYLASWLKVLKAEPRMLITAASKAQRAFDYFMEKAEKGKADSDRLAA